MKILFAMIFVLITSKNITAAEVSSSYYCYCAQVEYGYAPYYVFIDDNGSHQMTRIDPFDYPSVTECQYALYSEPLCR